MKDSYGKGRAKGADYNVYITWLYRLCRRKEDIRTIEECFDKERDKIKEEAFIQDDISENLDENINKIAFVEASKTLRDRLGIPYKKEETYRLIRKNYISRKIVKRLYSSKK
ncbi:hypothetical protein KY366_08635 [Candidatus Woesearchaeota archaeon]|nr:hypothetical protein [Candidatus Woesearchaeota archaeon]